jgi:acetyltransferase-like isoleucine patch superfamily enzyme
MINTRSNMHQPQVTSADKRTDAPPTPELLRSRKAALLLPLYASLRGPGASTCRRMLARVIGHLEGSEMRSATLRRIMSQCHGIEIGAHSYGCFDPIRFPSGTRIDRYVSVGPGVAAYRRNHPLDRLSLHPYFYNPRHGANTNADVVTSPLVIEAGAWLGANAMILPGCQRIGRGAVVAAGAVVTRDIPDYAVAAGNPARVLRSRLGDAAMAAAERSEWWLAAPESVVNRFDMSQPWNTSMPLSATSDTL